MEYGLIGEKLGHSFSKTIHNLLGDYNYELLEIDKNSLSNFLKEKNFVGINVTIPYKQEVIKYLDFIDDNAKEINAVNTIVNDNGTLKGYNTDYIGLKTNILKNDIDINNKIVAILGTGGTSKTATEVCKNLNAKRIYIVSRKDIDNKNLSENIEIINYDELYDKNIDIIINTTPSGMYPNIYDMPIDINKFNNLSAVVDVIYNPLNTNIILSAKKLGIKYATGLYMLVAQAVYANKLFFNENINDENNIVLIDKIYRKVYNSKINIVLIGMPGSGKTSIGSELSKKYNKEFIDLDIKFEKKYSLSPSEFILKNGEKAFRDYESEIVSSSVNVNNAIISTGGGVILRENNIDNLKRNGIIYFIDRDLDLIIPTEDRPLSNDYESLKKRYDERIDLYKKYSDKIIKNNTNLSDAINQFDYE